MKKKILALGHGRGHDPGPRRLRRRRHVRQRRYRRQHRLSQGAGSASNVSASDFKVGAIYINKKSDTAGYTYAHHTGITKAMEALGMDLDKQLFIVDEVPGGRYRRWAPPWTPWWVRAAISSSASLSAI
ncbi:MAG: hypothetical protein ACLUJG_12630 [Lawsonibacter sp.]